MSDLQYLDSYTFPTDKSALASLSIRVDVLANRLGFPVLEWIEDGLGPTRGFAVRLNFGRVYVLTEHLLSIEHSYSQGPIVWVDASDLARYGAVTLLAEFLVNLELAQTDVSWVADHSSELEAAKIVAEVEAHRKER